MRASKFRAVVAVVAVVGLTAPSALASALPKVPVAVGHLSGSQFQIKPKSIVYSGDGSGFFAGRKRAHHKAAPLKWTSWTATGGRGSGFNWLNDCKPNCAGGTFHLYPVKLHVWRHRKVGGHLIFTRMTVTYTGTRPPHTEHVQVWKVKHSGGGVFFWAMP